MATIRDTDLLYVQRGETPHNWTGLELKSLVSAAAKDGKLTIGQYLTPNGQTYDGSSNLTINVDGTSSATANKVVARDSSGDFAGNVITAVSFVGDGQNLTNTGASLSAAAGSQRLVTTNLTTGTMVTAATDADLYFNADTNTLHCTNFSGDGAGLSNTGASLSATSGSQRLVMTTLTSGTMITASTDGDLTFNASNNTLSCTNFSGNGSNLSSLNASNISSGTISDDRLPGTITSDLSGNAASATKLQTSRSINGTNFNGTANITTSFWGTTRTINGVSVNGSANYTLEPYVERDDSSDGTRYITFVDNSTAGYKRLNMDSSLTYNPSTNSISINVGGTATNATLCRVDHDTGNAWHRIVMVDDGSSSGSNLRLKTDNGSTCAINPSSNQIRATTFVGALSGNASTATSASSATNATNTTNFNVSADNSTNSNHYVIFTGGATGNQRPNSDTAFYYNPSSNTLNAGNFNSTSDISLKENIRMIDGPLTILKDIEGVRFDWKETGRATLGVVAQNVETVLPELVDENEGLKSVNYNGLISVLIESVKEQQKQIDDLKKQIESLSK